MIAKHSHEQSQKGEGVEVIENRPHEVMIIELSLELFDSLFEFFCSRIQSMEVDSTQRKESTLGQNCQVGSEKWSRKPSMSQKKPGTITPSQ